MFLCSPAIANLEQLQVAYEMQVRSILEYACPVWCGLLNEVQKVKLEAIQRLSLSVILGRETKSHAANLSRLGLTTLDERRLVLAKEFAIKMFIRNRHRGAFQPNPRFGDNSRVVQPRILLPKMRNARGDKAPLNFLGSLINAMDDEEFQRMTTPTPPPPP